MSYTPSGAGIEDTPATAPTHFASTDKSPGDAGEIHGLGSTKPAESNQDSVKATTETSGPARYTAQNIPKDVLKEYVDRIAKESDFPVSEDGALELLKAANFDIQEALIILCKRNFAKMPPGTAYAENLAFAMGGKEGLKAFWRGQSTANAGEQDVSKDFAINYWITVNSGDQQIQIPIKPEQVLGPEKDIVNGGMKAVWNWIQEQELQDKFGLQDAYDLVETHGKMVENDGAEVGLEGHH
ncbi:hypothetical protein N0V90_008845 [Kalmusia sp. IMI 367209]|nr:hypothetical protein N0V90_008845 [Kalmusia sp. IMI 367209]